MSDISEIDSSPAIITYVNDPIAGRVFAKTIPQCYTCMSPWRDFIETQFVIGRRAAEIIDLLRTREGEDIGLSEAGVNRHFLRLHCTTAQALRLAPQWNKAVESGLDPQDFEEIASSAVAITKLAIDKIREEFLAGDFTMDAKDKISLIKLFYEMEKQSGAKGGSDYASNDIFVAVSIFMAHVQAAFARFVPMDQHEAMEYFRRLLETDPILKDIIKRSREMQVDVEDFDEEQDVVDATIEIVQETVDSVVAIEYTPSATEEDVDPAEAWDLVELP